MKKAFYALAALALFGCKEEAKTKDWYLAHDKERAERVQVCKNDAREMESADCKNAMDAHSQVFLFGE